MGIAFLFFEISFYPREKTNGLISMDVVLKLDLLSINKRDDFRYPLKIRRHKRLITRLLKQAKALCNLPRNVVVQHEQPLPFKGTIVMLPRSL